MIEGTFLISNRSSDYAKPNPVETQFPQNGIIGKLPGGNSDRTRGTVLIPDAAD
jgi:hypothetical protein